MKLEDIAAEKWDSKTILAPLRVGVDRAPRMVVAAAAPEMLALLLRVAANGFPARSTLCDDTYAMIARLRREVETK